VSDRAGSATDRFIDPVPSRFPINREERLESILRELERRFGPWIVYRLKDRRPTIDGSQATEPGISTSALSLDLATGIGGFPRGKIVEVIGPRGSGKSVLAFHVLANAQRQRGFVTFVDAAHRAGFEQMARCGVDLADLFLVVPETAREALDVATLLVESAGLDALVLGPLTGLFGSSVQEAANAARRLAHLNAAMRQSPTAVTFLTDDPIPPMAVSFGRAIRHFASLRLQVTPRFPLLHPSGDVAGLRVHVEVVKNRLAPARRRTELDVRLDRGIHPEADLVQLGLSTLVLEERPSGICFGNQFLGRGRTRAAAALERDPDLARSLWEAMVVASSSSIPLAPFLPPGGKGGKRENGAAIASQRDAIAAHRSDSPFSPGGRKR
jgi:recombination protein RecA